MLAGSRDWFWQPWKGTSKNPFNVAVFITPTVD